MALVKKLKVEAEDLFTLPRKCAWALSSVDKDCQIDGYAKAVNDLIQCMVVL